MSIILHDSYDEEAYQHALTLSPKLEQTITTHQESLPQVPDMAQDIFLSLYHSYPQVNHEDKNISSFITRKMMEEMMTTVEWKNLRIQGTIGDEFYSAFATTCVLPQMIKGLGEKATKQLKNLHVAEKKLEELQDLTELSSEKDPFIKEIKQEEKKIERLSKALESLDEKIRSSFQEGLAQAESEIEDMEKAIKAFTSSYGTEQGTGGQTLSIQQKIELAKQVAGSTKLKQIADLCGRLTRIALSTQRSKIEELPHEVSGIEFGKDLSRVVPTELAFLDDPDMELLFWMKFLGGKLQQYEMHGREKLGRGPIIAAIDSSGSMGNSFGEATREAWGKAVQLALLAIAKKQKRDCIMMHFSGPGQVYHFTFLKGIASPQELLQTSEFFFGGGTDYQRWMYQALEFVKQSTFSKADVICISDGDILLNQRLIEHWNTERTQKEMKCYGVLIGTQYGKEQLDQICDQVITLLSPNDEKDALNMMFSI